MTLPSPATILGCCLLAAYTAAAWLAVEAAAPEHKWRVAVGMAVGLVAALVVTALPAGRPARLDDDDAEDPL